MKSIWSIVESSFDVTAAKAYEGLFTLGSGYLHVRGSFEEHLADAPQGVVSAPGHDEYRRKVKWGAYVPGIYGTSPSARRQIVNLPFFLDLAPEIDGERLDMEQSRVTGYRRELDLHAALLRRSLVWNTRFGARVTVGFERFVSAARPALCVQRLTLVSDRDVRVTVRGGIDANVSTVNCNFFETVTLAPAGAAGVDCSLRTNLGDTVALRTMLAAPGAAWAYDAQDRLARCSTELQLRAGVEVKIEKRTAVSTSRDRAPRAPSEILAAAAPYAFEVLRAEHAVVWEARWHASDVVIDGDLTSQRALRMAIYHLLRTLVRGDDRVAICAKGYAGELYQGLFFWDTEMFMLPFYLYTDPAAARALMDFRVQALPGAQRTAARYKYAGARYPWTSDDQGDECCGPWIFRDHQVHVTADVVYGLAHYACAANTPEYLRGPAARVIVETARYWLSRVDRRAGDPRPHLLGVMGPDEFTAMTNNSAYTNRLVAYALGLAAEVGGAGGATPRERAAFKKVGAGLPIPRSRDGKLVLQCEEFEGMAEMDINAEWKNRRIMFCWQVPQERFFRSKCLKQADVILLMTLFPHEFSRQEKLRAWSYYLPHTTHDSSLSFGTHCIMAAALGLEKEAWDFWQRGSELDLNVKHGSAAEGIHIAAAGNAWQAVVFGFAGVLSAMQADTLTLQPRLPKKWKRLAFPLVWKGTPVYIEITTRGVTITNRGAAPLAVRVHGRTREVPPAGSATFPA